MIRARHRSTSSISGATRSAKASSAAGRRSCGVVGSLTAWSSFRDPGRDLVRAALRGRRLVHPQQLDLGRGAQDRAEGLHQVADVLARAAPVAHPLELVEARQLDLELERRATRAAGERHQQTGVAALLAGGLDLTADEVDRALAVGRQHVVGEAGEVHRGPSDRAVPAAPHGGTVVPIAGRSRVASLTAHPTARLSTSYHPGAVPNLSKSIGYCWRNHCKATKATYALHYG